MDRLERLWNLRRDFTVDVLQRTRGLTIEDLHPDDIASLTRLYALSMHKELGEALDDVNWKEHRKREGPEVAENVLEELIDVQKFLWGLMQIWGFSVDDFMRAYLAKDYVIKQRLKMSNRELTEPVWVVDLDDVLYDYGASFSEWLKEHRPYMANLTKRDNALLWEEAKHAYRQSHAKRDGGVNEGNVDALWRAKAEGVAGSVVLMTARPIRLYKGMECDTLVWLDKHKVPVDRIIWSAYEKAFYMREEMQRAEVFIDNEYETCVAVEALGKRTYCINEHLSTPWKTQGVVCAYSLSEIVDIERRRRGE